MENSQVNRYHIDEFQRKKCKKEKQMKFQKETYKVKQQKDVQKGERKNENIEIRYIEMQRKIYIKME